MKPTIGVVPLWDDERNSIWLLPGYMNALREAGALPIILPLEIEPEDLTQIAQLCDGFLLTGGQDVDPAIYGEAAIDECGRPCGERDRLERAIFEYAVENDRPIFGICRGIQFINAICGGSLYQDLPSQYPPCKDVVHQMTPPYDRPCHRVTILPETPLAAIVEQSELAVNSYHHQAIKQISPQLRAMAISEDGLVEAVYMPHKRFIQAVQWHPELNHHCDESSRKIMRSFVEACSLLR